jgi:hypothetical protein
MANTEQIEAKLCAYVDGELDAAGVAEIEQHLAANPQHGALLQELIAQRQMLRDLPRDNAPEDLYENFQSQLERAVLLGAKGAGSPVAGRINPWPQIFSVAAIFLLAIGLFAVIYFVLPTSSRRAAQDYAKVTPTTAPSGTQPIPEVVADPAAAMKMATTLPTGPLDSTPTEVAVAPMQPPPSIMPPTLTNAARSDIFTGEDALASRRAMSKGESVNLGTGGGFGGLFDATPLEPEIEQKLKDSPDLPDNCMLVVVASPRPAELDQQVTQYLAQNKIRWDDVPEPMPKPIDMKRSETYASKIQRPQSYELRERATQPLGKGDAVATVEKDQQRGQQQVAQRPAAAPNAPAAAAQTAEPPPAAAATPAPTAVAQSTPQEKQAVVAPTTQPATEVAIDIFSQRQQVQPQQQQQRIAATFDDARGQRLQQQQQGGYVSNRLIVARGVTRSQLAELNTSLIAQNAGKLSNFTCARGSITPTAPALASNATEQLQRSFSGTTQPFDRSIDEAKAKNLAATSQPALVASTAPAASQSIIGGGSITRSNGTTHPTTMPARDKLAADEKEVAADRITQSQPAGGPATAVADESFDVVIVVHPTIAPEPPLATEPPPNAAAAPPAATAPATVPAD